MKHIIEFSSISVSLVAFVGLLSPNCPADQIETVDSSPVAVGGDYIRKITIDEHNWSYIHVFTNASVATMFKSVSIRPLDIRYLVAGGGGAGGNGGGTGTANKGGGGGGGGGVVEVKGVSFPAGSSWAVRVGAGANGPSMHAGSSSISNGVNEICAVPGGGNGGSGTASAEIGAAGGGGFNGGTGAAGSFASHVLGMTPAGSGYSGGNSKNYAGGGGGGASTAGGNGSSVSEGGNFRYTGGAGGEGLVSDITGEAFVYGSGGGGGSLNGSANYGSGGVGGTNAGSGGGRGAEASITLSATEPVPNSGAGGGGGCGNNSTKGTMGANGIVVIRYDYSWADQGLILIVR